MIGHSKTQSPGHSQSLIKTLSYDIRSIYSELLCVLLGIWRTYIAQTVYLISEAIYVYSVFFVTPIRSNASITIISVSIWCLFWGDDSGGTFGGLDRGSTVYIKVERNKALWTLLFRPGIKIVLHSEMENIFFFLARGPLTMCPNRYISHPFVSFFFRIKGQSCVWLS